MGTNRQTTSAHTAAANRHTNLITYHHSNLYKDESGDGNTYGHKSFYKDNHHAYTNIHSYTHAKTLSVT